jgi:hypothetical protein
MRELKATELNFVSGAGDECTADSGNDLAGVTDSENLGRDLINIYEGVVAAASHVIERVADAFSDD